MPFDLPPIAVILATFLVLFLGVGIHEYAHCKVADMMGDPTPSFYGRVTLDLTKHFEPMGTLFMVMSSLSGFGLGWGKASPINPTKMRNPRVGTVLSVAAGPFSNLCQAVIYSLAIRASLALTGTLPQNEFLQTWLILGVLINLGLCLFNLIPFGPLDGHWLIGEMMPEKQRFYWYRFNRSIGLGGLFLIVLLSQTTHTNILGAIIGPPREAMFKVLTGLGTRDGN